MRLLISIGAVFGSGKARDANRKNVTGFKFVGESAGLAKIPAILRHHIAVLEHADYFFNVASTFFA